MLHQKSDSGARQASKSQYPRSSDPSYYLFYGPTHKRSLPRQMVLIQSAQRKSFIHCISYVCYIMHSWHLSFSVGFGRRGVKTKANEENSSSFIIIMHYLEMPSHSK